MGRASFFLKFYSMFTLYHIGEGKCIIFPKLFAQCCEQLNPAKVVLAS